MKIKMDEHEITIDFPEGVYKVSLVKLLKTIQIAIIEDMLKRTNWNKTQTAKMLCMNRTTLIEKLKTFKILLIPTRPEFFRNIYD
jgi:DNA-binding NtrC family response regulator